MMNEWQVLSKAIASPMTELGALPPVGLPALRLVSGRADQRLSDDDGQWKWGTDDGKPTQGTDACSALPSDPCRYPACVETEHKRGRDRS